MPAGYFFVVTDVTMRAWHSSATSTGWVRAGVASKSASGYTGDYFVTTLGSDNEAQLRSFNAPILVLVEGEYLIANNASSSTSSIDVIVAGYLTDQPEKLRL